MCSAQWTTTTTSTVVTHEIHSTSNENDGNGVLQSSGAHQTECARTVSIELILCSAAHNGETKMTR